MEHLTVGGPLADLMAYPGAQVLSINGSSIQEARYDETGHFATMKRFLFEHDDG